MPRYFTEVSKMGLLCWLSPIQETVNENGVFYGDFDTKTTILSHNIRFKEF